MKYKIEAVPCGHMYSRHYYTQWMVIGPDGYAAGNPYNKVKLYDTAKRAQESADKMNRKVKN